jgi:prepilin signal peptidase PulO-like enzyme (type II secretory pathway)
MTDTLVLFVWLTLLVVLVALFVYDLRWMVLPNKLVAVFSALALVKILLLSFETGAAALVLASAGAVTLGGIFYLLHAISDGKWIGGGDVKLGFGLGLLAGNPVGALLLLFIASLLGSLISLPQLISRNLSLSSRLPFGPLLIIAAFVVVLIGQDIINVYQDIFLIHHE